jgi:hypothetical protein
MWAAEAEAHAADNPIPVPLGNRHIHIPPMWQWPREAIPALICDDHTAWAHLVLDDDSWALFAATDPDLDGCDQLIEAWEQRSGQSLDTVARMWHILDRWPDELESDLVAHCNGQDLRHLWQPSHGPSQLTWRRLGVLYNGLPGQSLTKTAEANDLGETKMAELAKQPRRGFSPMSRTDMVIADLIDAVNHNTFILQLANTPQEKRSQVRRPEPYPRPGVSRRKSLGSPFRQATPEARRVVAHMRANNGALPGTWVNVAALPKAQ